MSKPLTPLPVRRTDEVSPIIQRLCRGITRLLGWRVSKWTLPDEVKKVVVLGEHHTSNMDGILMVIFVAAMGRKLSWLVKEELNKPIIGSMIRASGGIFVDRHHPNGTVGHVVEIINAHNEIFLALAPSGTRSKTDRWRSGFYYMALGADVPVALGFLDYSTNEGGIGKVITLSGDIEADLEIFQDFYANVTARYPDKASTIHLEPRSPHSSERKAS
jgi:1-acyl-sn-glycerol-3-phosphate acyltransferase